MTDRSSRSTRSTRLLTAERPDDHHAQRSSSTSTLAPIHLTEGPEGAATAMATPPSTVPEHTTSDHHESMTPTTTTPSPSPSLVAEAEALDAPTDTNVLKACAADLRRHCQHEAELVKLLGRIRTTVEPWRLATAESRMQICLVEYAESLSTHCVHSLVERMEATADQGDLPPAEPTANKQHGTNLVPASVRVDTTGKGEATIAATRVRTNDDSEMEVRIILVNHHNGGANGAIAGATTMPPLLRIGGDASQYTDGDHTATLRHAGGASLAMPGWLWVALLPFLCIGIYVSVTHAMAYLRRRRDVVYRVGASQYMPIPSSSATSK